MILEDLYQIESQDFSKENHTLSTRIKINKDHVIFQGHFPNNPVMPGVCMMQIIKDFTSNYIGKALFMERCSNVKFMALINPEINPVLDLEIQINADIDGVKIKNITKMGDVLALKLSAQYRIVS